MDWPREHAKHLETSLDVHSIRRSKYWRSNADLCPIDGRAFGFHPAVERRAHWSNRAPTLSQLAHRGNVDRPRAARPVCLPEPNCEALGPFYSCGESGHASQTHAHTAACVRIVYLILQHAATKEATACNDNAINFIEHINVAIAIAIEGPIATPHIYSIACSKQESTSYCIMQMFYPV